MTRKSLDNGLDAVRLAARHPQRSYQGRSGCRINGIKWSHCQGNPGINVQTGTTSKSLFPLIWELSLELFGLCDTKRGSVHSLGKRLTMAALCPIPPTPVFKEDSLCECEPIPGCMVDYDNEEFAFACDSKEFRKQFQVLMRR